MSRDGTIRKTDDGHEIRFQRRFAHPPERVWDMLTRPELIPTWYVRTELEPRVGGKMVEHHDHAGASFTGRIITWDPPRAFAHIWAGDDEETDDVLRWDLQPDGDGTILTLTLHSRRDTDPGTAAGFHVLLDILDDVLGGGDPDAHAPPTAEARDGAFVITAPGRGRWRDEPELRARYERLAAR